MKEERFFYVPEAESCNELPQEEAVHAVRVLRLHEGDDIYLMNGMGTFYHAEVTMASSKHCSYSIKETLPQEREWKNRIHLAIAPTKMMERMEWMAEKATEVGIDEFTFLDCQYSERHKIRTDRIEKIVVAAMKQSRKAWKPVINELTPFIDFIKTERKGRKYICHCHNEYDRHELTALLMNEDCDKDEDGDITILIGPEGDFSMEEVKAALDNGYKSVSLGTSRLRTETAALRAVMTPHICESIKEEK